MAVQIIRIPDRMRGRGLRSVLWDAEPGTVDGDHDQVEFVRQTLAADNPVTVGDQGGTWDLADLGHDPVEFLTPLGIAHWPAIEEPLRSRLPAVFDGIEVPPTENGEILYD